MTKLISFYSIKGGSGRSLALANCAVLLARAGRRIECVDMDVAAPGLVSIFGVKDPALLECVSTLDLLFSAMDPGTDFLQGFKLIDLGQGLSLGRDQLLLLPAKHEPKDKIERMGDVGEKNLWSAPNMQHFYASYLRPVAASRNLDYIFIDSRSGVAQSSFSALSLILAAEGGHGHVVVFMRLDSQSRQVTRHFLSVWTEYGNPRKPVLVATNVPSGDRDIKLSGGAFKVSEAAYEVLDSFNAGIYKDFGVQVQVLIPHDPKLLIEHTIVVRDDPASPAAGGYRALSELMQGLD